MKGPEAPRSPGSLYGTDIIILRRANKGHQLAIANGHGHLSKHVGRSTVRRKRYEHSREDMASRNSGSTAPMAAATYNPLRDVGEPCALNKDGQSHCRVRIGRVPRSQRSKERPNLGLGLCAIYRYISTFLGPESHKKRSIRRDFVSRVNNQQQYA